MVTRDEVLKHLADCTQILRKDLIGEQCLNATYYNWDDKLIYPECYIRVDMLMKALFRLDILAFAEWEKW